MMLTHIIELECPDCHRACKALLILGVIDQHLRPDGLTEIHVRPTGCRWTRGCGHVTPASIHKMLTDTGASGQA